MRGLDKPKSGIEGRRPADLPRCIRRAVPKNGSEEFFQRTTFQGRGRPYSIPT